MKRDYHPAGDSSNPSAPHATRPSVQGDRRFSPDPERPAQDHEEDLKRRVQLFLESYNIPGLRHLTVEVDGDTVLLRGRVGTFYEKQLAGKCSRRVAGVIHVVDLIEVASYAPRLDGRSGETWRPGNFQLQS